MTQPLLDELPPAQRLALAYAPRPARPATLALLALDGRLGAVLRRRGDPVLAQKRFAWWRDVLGKPQAEWPRGDAVLGALGEWRDPVVLASLVDGWEGLLAETLDAETIDAFAAGRGRAFAQLAVELGVSADSAGVCAVRWALADLAANVADSRERATVIERARALPPRGRLPRALRPLAVLAALGQRSLDSDGTALLDGPGAALLAVRVGMIGR
jgi:phytoene synthase